MNCPFCDPRCPEWRTSRQGLRERIQNYFQVGGLFNPEAMEHDKVRELLLDVSKFLESKE